MNQGTFIDGMATLRQAVEEAQEAATIVVFKCHLCLAICTASDRSPAHPGLFLCRNCREMLNPQPTQQ